MSGSAWHIEDDAVGGPEPASGAAPGTVSLAFIRATLRRLWYVWMACTLAGASLAVAWVVLLPPQSVGTVTLLLAHDPATQPDTAMATDVRLLKTRTVAQEVSDRLGLDVSPEDLQTTILVAPATSSVLEVEITASNPDDAVNRARVLAHTYLTFRETQLLLQSKAITQGYTERIGALQSQVDDVTTQYDQLTSQNGSSDQAADLINLRGRLLTEIDRLANQVESDQLEVNAVTAASRVLDPASLVPQSPLRRAVLTLGSGLIGGLMVGLGLVVVYAITTGRLRSRADVASAMGLPVMFSAGRVAGRWRRRGPRDTAALELLVAGMATALPTRGEWPLRLGLVSVDCAREGAKVVAGLAHRLAQQKSVVALDLVTTGLLDVEVGSLRSGPVAEPAGSVAVVSGPTIDVVADVVLSLVPFEIGRGLAHVKSTTPRCVILVKAGRSTPEALRTVAQAARASGLDVAFAMLVGADRSDASFGGGVARHMAPPAR